MKYYAVESGCNPGIYTDWDEAWKQVDGFPGAKHKGFKTREEAEEFMADPTYWPDSISEKSKKAVTEKYSDYPKNSIIVYADGSAIGNPGPGGYGVVTNTGKTLSGGFKCTTNNRMELMAVIKALGKFKKRKKQILIHSDSSYVINGITKGWAMNWKRNKWVKSNGDPAINPELWKKLLVLVKKLNVTFIKVKAHSGNPLNEKADKLANSAARKKGLPDDVGYLDLI